jgi:shikimate dehydrogenase
MLERAFAAAGLEWRCLTLEVCPEDLEDAMRGMRAFGLRGGSVTLPHKVAVIPYLDELSETAQKMGAVNCVRREDKRLIGENTEGQGFVLALREEINPKKKRIVVFGAGGAARAICLELGLAGAAEITVVNRTAERAEELVERLREHAKTDARSVVWNGDYAVEDGTDIVINATPIGMADADARLPLHTESLTPSMVVADVIVNPADTRFLRDATERGCATLPGPSMLVQQGILAFRTWTGIEPDVNVLREALEEYLEL